MIQIPQGNIYQPWNQRENKTLIRCQWYRYHKAIATNHSMEPEFPCICRPTRHKCGKPCENSTKCEQETTPSTHFKYQTEWTKLHRKITTSDFYWIFVVVNLFLFISRPLIPEFVFGLDIFAIIIDWVPSAYWLSLIMTQYIYYLLYKIYLHVNILILCIAISSRVKREYKICSHWEKT